jgi:CelD/BcsL family acetyltransferase involved in cellulose biosynthesis
MGSHGFTVDVFERIEALRYIAADWDALAHRSGTPLLSADWFLACAETLCAESDLRVVVVRRAGVLCAVAPLVVVRHEGIERLEVLGVSALYEPSGFLYDSAESLHHLVEKIVGLQMPAVFDRIAAESPLAGMFRELIGYRGVIFCRSTAPAAYVATIGSWEEYFQSISSQRRYDYQRKRKRMERFGRVGVRIECPRGGDGLPIMLEKVFRVEGAGWKGRSGSGLLANERVRKFIARYSEMACDQGTLAVCFLEIEEQPIATILGIVWEKRFWVLKIGYDEQWARCSPGIQLTMETIRYAFDHGLEAYEFLGSEESWQAIWPRHRHELMSIAIYPVSCCGLSALGHDLRRHGLQRIRRALAGFT